MYMPNFYLYDYMRFFCQEKKTSIPPKSGNILINLSQWSFDSLYEFYISSLSTFSTAKK